MGLLSSSKSSKTTQNITDIDTTNVVASEGSIAAEGLATVNVLDAGAVSGSLDLGRKVVELGRDTVALAGEQSAAYQGALGESFAEALGFAERIVSSYQEATDRQVGSSVQAIASLAEGRQQGESALWTRIAGWALLGAVAITALVRFTK